MKTKKTSRFVWRVVWGAVALVVAPLVALVAALAAISVVLRLGGSKGRDAVRAFNKRVLNPAMMKLAGRRHWYAAVIRHRGHRSGKEYATPVVAVRVAGDAFIIPLPYGEGVDWLRNVLADGRATIEIKGETYDVFDPEVFGVEKAFPLLDERHRRTWRRFGIERYLRLKEVYGDPGAPRWEELRRFRDAHPPKHTTVGGVRWDYIASGDGDEALLILPGGAMVGEAGFTRIPAYEENYRVIAPSYASVSTAAELLDGLAGVLDAEGVREAHVIGQSYGGLVAQCFVRRHPERARSLILTNTLVPPRRMLRLSKVLLRLLPLVPVGWLRKLRERGLARAFHGVPGVPLEDQAFWSEYQHGLISRQSKAELLDLYRLGIDLVQSHRFAPGDLASWPGRIFILESDEDILTPERRAELRRCYPRADVYTIHGAGHTPWMSHKEEYLSAIKEFLAGHVPAAPSRASLEQRPHAVRHPSEESGAAAFPFQRPGRLVRAFFKGGTCAYRGPAARLMGATSMLLLTTTGRKTGLPRRTALTFQPLDGRYLVLAGMGTRSDWYRNLLAQPRVEVRIGARRFAATAEPVLDPARRRMLAPGIAEQWDRFGPPRPLRWLLRRWLRFDYDAELAYALAHAEDLPMVELAPSGRSGTNRSAGRTVREQRT